MKTIVGIAVAGLVALGGTSSATAATCNNVEIHIHNVMNVFPIKFVDFEYGHQIANVWYEENFVDNEVIEPGDDYLFVRDLGHVEGVSNMIRAQVRLSSGSGGWGNVYDEYSAYEVCQDGQHYDVYIDYDTFN